jgi:Domain of unknown function (DUF932)
MSKPIVITGSYLQENRHANVSERFNVVKPAAIGEVMGSNGLQLASLSTGRARHEDKADFQRTLSRYRGPQIADGVYLDVIYDSKHMGRGVDKILLGIYRLVCTNGLFVGMNFFKHEIRHAGNTYDNLQLGISAALGTQAKLSKTIEKFQSIQLDATQREAFAQEAVKLLTPYDAVNVKHALLRPRRNVDQANDLWTTYNVIQENAMQGRSVAYTLQSVDAFGREIDRTMTARRIKPNSGKDADFNQALFGIAEKIAA